MEATTRIELDGQYRALREAAGVVERSGRRALVVRGVEAGEYLQGQLTNDVEALEAGEGCYAALLDRKGHMQGDMRVLRIGAEEYLIDTEAPAGDAVLRHLETYRIGREVEIEDESQSRVLLSVIGPAADEVAGSGPLGREHASRAVVIGDADCLAVATDVGVDLLCEVGAREAVVDRLGDSGAVGVSEAAAEILRVETGRPRFGREMTTATIPQEAGINERAVSFDKGCYIGQETVARLHYRGKPNRSLRGLRLAEPVAAGESIRLGEREVGEIGTAVLSPAHGPIALAIVRREAEPGSRVVVGEEVEAEVVQPPF